jgi:hypothetical protein
MTTSPPMPHAAGSRYDPMTLARDAMAAAGAIVRGADPADFDPMRAALALEHAPLVRGAGGDMHLIASRISQVLEQTTRRAESQVRAEQEALRDL